MRILTVSAVVAGLTAAVIIWIFMTTGIVLLWAVFLGWGSFAAIGGRAEHIALNVSSNALGCFAAWLHSVFALCNLAPEILPAPLWVAVLGFVIVTGYILASKFSWFSALPAASIAYAGTFAYVAQTPGAFTLHSLLSFSMGNAFIGVTIAMAMGTLFAQVSNKVTGFLSIRLCAKEGV
jgi:Protein of unknown function (DUF1097)